MRSIGVLIVRLVVGGLLAGHGAQKLFGAFGGPGVEGTSRWLETMRLRPGDAWARMAGGSELGGGLLTVLGFLNPLGPIAGIGAMAMAWAKVHLGKPVWVTKGGPELPLTNIAVLSAMTIAGPGKLSVDGLLGIRLPRWIGATALAGMFAALWLGAREELRQGLGTVVAGGGEMEGDPSADAADRAEVERAAASATASSESEAGTASETRGLVGVMDPDLAAGTLSGAEAGTAMGVGALGSETGDEA